MFLEISQTKGVFLRIVRNFQEQLFLRTLLVDPSEKLIAEAVFRRCSVKKVFLKISQNSQENTCTRVSFLQSLACNFSRWHRCFPVYSANTFLRTLFFRAPLVPASVKAYNFTKMWKRSSLWLCLLSSYSEL